MKPADSFILGLCIAVMGIGATCQQATRTVLDVADTACILFHEEIEDEVKLAQACGIAEALIPELRKILAARKSAMAQKKALHDHDGGASAPPSPLGSAPSSTGVSSVPAPGPSSSH